MRMVHLMFVLKIKRLQRKRLWAEELCQQYYQEKSLSGVF